MTYNFSTKDEMLMGQLYENIKEQGKFIEKYTLEREDHFQIVEKIDLKGTTIFLQYQGSIERLEPFEYKEFKKEELIISTTDDPRELELIISETEKKAQMSADMNARIAELKASRPTEYTGGVKNRQDYMFIGPKPDSPRGEDVRVGPKKSK